jgi:hypothetical protein
MNSAPDRKAIESAMDPRPDYTSFHEVAEAATKLVVAAECPRPGTRADQVLQAILSGPQNQYDIHGCGWRLAANIQKLEDLGWRFITREIMRPACRRTIKEYRIDRSDPGTAAALSARGLL